MNQPLVISNPDSFAAEQLAVTQQAVESSTGSAQRLENRAVRLRSQLDGHQPRRTARIVTAMVVAAGFAGWIATNSSLFLVLVGAALATSPFLKGIFMSTKQRSLKKTSAGSIASRKKAADAAERSGQLRAGMDAERDALDAIADLDCIDAILCGLPFGPGTGDIDLIVLSTGNAVVIEVKAGSGPLTALKGGKVQAGRRILPRAPITQCRKQVKLLADHTDTSAVGVVCVAGSNHPPTWLPEQWTWLVGGGAQLSKLVVKLMGHRRGIDPHPIILGRVVEHLSNVRDETAEWIAGKDESIARYLEGNERDEAKIAKWADTISRAESEGWREAHDIVSNLTQQTANARQRIRERDPKLAAAREKKAGYRQRLAGIDNDLRVVNRMVASS